MQKEKQISQLEVSTDQAEETEEDENTEKVDENNQSNKCNNSFIMWFNNGIPITTVECDKYSIIYSGVKEGDTKPRYINGKITSVVINSDSDIKINDVKLSEISTDIGEPTQKRISTSSKSRLLVKQDDTEIKMVKVYSFKLNNRDFDVYLPESEEVSKRNEYGLSSNGKMFYKGSDNESKYQFNSKGDLLDSNNKVVLEADSSSFAFKINYIIPSLLLIFLSIIFI